MSVSEPLLNFELISSIVGGARRRAAAASKKVSFVIATNLALLTDGILAFCRSNEILLSTSLDGPADLHNKNRPRRGNNSHALVEAGLQRARDPRGAGYDWICRSCFDDLKDDMQWTIADG